MAPESSLLYLKMPHIYSYPEPDQFSLYPQSILLKIRLNIKFLLCLGLPSVQIDIHMPKIITNFQIFPPNVSRTVQSARYQLKNCTSSGVRFGSDLKMAALYLVQT